MSKIKNYMFEVELLHEPSGKSMIATVPFETDDPESIMDANWSQSFQDTIFDEVSIVPQSYEEA
jgi:hypothetical protein